MEQEQEQEGHLVVATGTEEAEVVATPTGPLLEQKITTQDPTPPSPPARKKPS